MLLPHLALDLPDQRRVRDAPETALVAAIQLYLDERRLAFRLFRQNAVDAAFGLRVEREDRAQLRMRCEHELEPVLLGSFESFFVRTDLAAGKFLQLGKGVETLPLFNLAILQRELMSGKINRRIFVALKDF